MACPKKNKSDQLATKMGTYKLPKHDLLGVLEILDRGFHGQHTQQHMNTPIVFGPHREARQMIDRFATSKGKGPLQTSGGERSLLLEALQDMTFVNLLIEETGKIVRVGHSSPGVTHFHMEERNRAFSEVTFATWVRSWKSERIEFQAAA